MKNIVFIGGIHGVGKTTFCKKTLKRIGVKHYSAGHLIKSLNKELINNKNKKVVNINKNQNELVVAIDKYVEKVNLSLLDGHFCLLSETYEINDIPLNIFLKIPIRAIIILHDSIDNIQNKNSKRDGILYNSALLSSFQSRELEYSKYIAEELDVPYQKFDVNNDFEDILKFIKKFL